MAKHQMQCQVCKDWVDCPDRYQVNVPNHGQTKGTIKAKCSGAGKVPLRTKGFRNPPPSIAGKG